MSFNICLLSSATYLLSKHCTQCVLTTLKKIPKQNFEANRLCNAATFVLLSSPFQLDDATLQIYKDGDYGVYLDLESSLAEQSEEIEGLQGR